MLFEEANPGTRILRMNPPTTPTELPALLDALSDKADRLVLRHAELKRTNALLDDRIRQLEAERDSLRARLHEARARVDHLLARLDPPSGTSATKPSV